MISIIVPTYNRESTIRESVNSILRQTYEDIEVIIVDDSSTDNTIDIINEIDDNRIKIYKNKKNRGSNYSRNKGIKHAKGEYIAFNDSDDIWYKDKLFKQLVYLKENKLDIVSCYMYRIDEQNRTEIFPSKKLNIHQDLKEQFILKNYCGTQTLLMKKHVLENHKFNETLSRFQEWELMIRLSEVYKIGVYPEVLVDSFIQSDSISADNTKSYAKGLDSITKIYDLNEEYIRKDPKFIEEYYMRIAEYKLLLKIPSHEDFKVAYHNSGKIKYLIKYLLSKYVSQDLLIMVKKSRRGKIWN